MAEEKHERKIATAEETIEAQKQEIATLKEQLEQAKNAHQDEFNSNFVPIR